MRWPLAQAVCAIAALVTLFVLRRRDAEAQAQMAPA
jgi:hypothetical protein